MNKFVSYQKFYLTDEHFFKCFSNLLIINLLLFGLTLSYQFADNFNYILGTHSLKFGGDFNFVRIPSAVFELNFAGLFNFGDFNAANLGFPVNAPSFTPVQSYGLGLPSTYVQGFGDPVSQIKNTPIAFFAQDTWKATRRLTVNYGIRYDVEFTQTIAPVGIMYPLSRINLSDADILAAQDAVGVQQGFPRDTNNFAPRFGFAYDIFGDGKTVVRGALGLFYDHPLLAAAFNSDIADAAQQQQAVLTAGNPAPTSLLNAAQVFQGTVCVPGSTGCVTPLITNGRFSTGNLGRNRGITHSYASFDLRLTRAVHFGERVRLDLIAEGFNLSNRLNEASATPFFTDVNAFGQRDSGGRYFSRPTASFDPRQFQFGFKLNF